MSPVYICMPRLPVVHAYPLSMERVCVICLFAVRHRFDEPCSIAVLPIQDRRQREREKDRRKKTKKKREKKDSEKGKRKRKKKKQEKREGEREKETLDKRTSEGIKDAREKFRNTPLSRAVTSR